MKKLFIIAIALLFSAGTFAQQSTKTETKSPQAKTATHCYAMLNNAMVHCMGATTEPMTSDARLKNGIVVSANGSVAMKGERILLKNGQCIDMNGKIGDYAKMHNEMKKD